MITPQDMQRIMLLRRYRLGGYSPATGYRTDDLVLHLDGIQNTRLNKHSNDATVWEDLAGNMDVTLFNATWGADHAAFTGNDDSYGLGNEWTFSKGFTIEVVFKRDDGKNAIGLVGWSSAAVSGIRPQMWIRISLKITGRSNSLYYEHSRVLTGGEFLYSAFAKNITITNGVFETNTTNWSVGKTIAYLKIAAYGGTTATNTTTGLNFPGKIYAVRVYDANLTESELQAHWLIDKARFNIPE